MTSQHLALAVSVLRRPVSHTSPCHITRHVSKSMLADISSHGSRRNTSQITAHAASAGRSLDVRTALPNDDVCYSRSPEQAFSCQAVAAL
jgi:hypothetical protein